jgi:hypothetical protein
VWALVVAFSSSNAVGCYVSRPHQHPHTNSPAASVRAQRLLNPHTTGKLEVKFLGENRYSLLAWVNTKYPKLVDQALSKSNTPAKLQLDVYLTEEVCCSLMGAYADGGGFCCLCLSHAKPAASEPASERFKNVYLLTRWVDLFTLNLSATLDSGLTCAHRWFSTVPGETQPLLCVYRLVE